MGTLQFRILQRITWQMFTAFVALLISLPALAQTNGALRVSVEDDFALSIPAVTLTLTGSSLIGGAQEVVTDARGEYLFSSLPPGTYEVTATKAGFSGVTVRNIQVDVSRTTTEVVTMQAGSEEVVVDVVGTRDAVNVEDTSRGEILTNEVLQRIPTGRSYQTAVQLAAGVTGGANPNMAGGAFNENTYMLDGANITDPVTGTFSANFNFDALQQIEVLLGGYMPEYGVSLGGVVNLVTQSGTNNLEFDTSVFYENGNWSPKRDERITADGFELGPTQFDSNFEVLQIAARVSGPIVRDKAWFIISYQHSRTLISQTGIPQRRDFDGHYVLTKLTVQPSAEHRITAFMQMDPTSVDNIDQGDPFVKPEAQGRQMQGGFISSGRWQWFVSPNVNLDTQFTVQKSFIEVNAVPCTHNRERDVHPCKPGEEEGNIDWETPGRLGLGGAFASVNYGYYYFDDRWRYQASSKLSVLSVEDPFGGKHDIKVGVEGSQLIWDQIQGYSGNSNYYDVNRTPFDPESFENYYWLEITGPIKFRTSSSQWNFFIQDSWKPVSNLTINYGTRFDNSVVRDDLGRPTISNAIFGPRLFAAWDPFGDQKTKIATGWGRFNDTGRLGVASFTSAATYGSKLFLGEFFGGGLGAGSPGFLNGAQQMYDIGSRENLYSSNGDAMRAPRVDELLLTLEREVIEDFALFSSMSGKFTRFIWEPDEINFIYDEDGSSVIGSRYDDILFQRLRLRTPSLAKRDYVQWDLGFRKIESKRWAATGTYTYTQSFGSTSQANSGSFINDPQSQFNYGPLNTNLIHAVKAYGYWELPFDPWTPTLGFLFEYYSGLPLERRYYSDLGGYSLRIRDRGIYTTFAPEWNFSVRYQQAFDVRKGQLIGSIEARNLFNNQAPTSFSSAFYTEGRLFALSRQNPLRLQAGLRYKF